MTQRMSATEWEQAFPNRPQQSLTVDGILPLEDLEKIIDVHTLVLLPEQWPGMYDPMVFLNDEAAEGQTEVEQIVFRAGRWCATEEQVFCADGSYYIDYGRINDDEWFGQLMQKTWFYDPTDLLDALEFAHATYGPGTPEAYTERLIAKALEWGQYPFYPSRISRTHVYLTDRMDNEERSAFSRFLAERGYTIN